MKGSPLFILLMIAVFFQCATNDWEDRGGGLERQLLGFADEGARRVDDGLYTELHAYWLLPHQSAPWCADTIELIPREVREPDCQALLDELRSLSEGDSMRYRGAFEGLRCLYHEQQNAQCLPHLTGAAPELVLAVGAVYDSANYHLSPRFQRIRQHQRERQYIEEAIRLSGYRDQAQEYLGVWYIVVEEGGGPSARQGDEITLSYRGSFIDGRIFDDATDSLSFFYFPYGKPDQVVRGIEIALSQMKKGERRRIWLTSDLAFGSAGSKGIVPPHEPVCFELYLVDVVLAEARSDEQ